MYHSLIGRQLLTVNDTKSTHRPIGDQIVDQLVCPAADPVKDAEQSFADFDLALSIGEFKIHSDQINMAVFFWYFFIRDLSRVRYCIPVHWTSHLLQGTKNTQPCITGHPVI